MREGGEEGEGEEVAEEGVVQILVVALYGKKTSKLKLKIKKYAISRLMCPCYNVYDGVCSIAVSSFYFILQK